MMRFPATACFVCGWNTAFQSSPISHLWLANLFELEHDSQFCFEVSGNGEHCIVVGAVFSREGEPSSSVLLSTQLRFLFADGR
ncbi:hypothetical protein L596_027471 [Steinernema carpocapsae]|uniref:Uncharacterized protein n=1 Tax=Steinernema carpocapsae TaxID=34508 RepID=A0A4U5LVL0_STECR|nr:hypothetical protein L596_027471 [Steinernema carpocapsae]